MLKKDYLIRQFEDFGRALALILGFKKERDWEHFEMELEALSQQYSPWELSALEDLNTEEFEKKIVVNTGYSLDQKKIIANLLFEKIDLYLAVGEDDKLENIKQKCLLLLKHLQNNLTSNQFDLDVHYKLEVLSKL